MPLDPFVPDVSAPVKLTTVMDEADDCANVAVTLTFVNAVAATARQISAVPRLAFVRITNVQVRPPPLTFVTVFRVVTSSAAINATNS
jgi:hypothetical protein